MTATATERRRRAIVITSGGWTVAGLALAGLVAGATLGWTELVVIGLVCLVAVVVAAGFLVGRSSGRITIEVLDRQVTAGESAAVSVTASNDRAVRQRARRAELAVGGVARPVRLPALGAGESRSVSVQVPTERRGVIALGPVTLVRRDPIGLARRESVRSASAALYVHPPTVPLAVSSTGLLRDLEGIPVPELTDSDISFHALRGYLPGDDRRHIHWKSTAKTGSFLVRQFEQTRRSHLIVLQSLSTDDYAGDEEFELAVSVVASVGVRAVLDGASVSVLAGSPRDGGRLRSRTPRELLDDLAGVAESRTAAPLGVLAREVAQGAAEASLVVIACGSTVPARRLRAVAAHFGAGVEVVAVIAEPEAEPALVRVDALRMTRIGYLDDLARTLVRAVAV